MEGNSTLTDPCGRPVESIRISVTQRCNLACFYCHREGEVLGRGKEMTPEDIQRIVEIAASFSIRKVKLTGGEPLVRKDIHDIVHRIKSTHGVEEVSMTTNGILLSDDAEKLKGAGLARVNVSLDTLNPEKFKLITGTDAVEKVVSGIRAAVKTGLCPVKVNMVLLKDLNENEVGDMIEFAVQNGLILQIIELESPTETEAYKKYHAELEPVEESLKNISTEVVIRQMHHRRKYFLREGGDVEVVRPMHNTEFCQYCNRIRVTSDGKLKPCLFRTNNLTDFIGPMRKGASEDTLKTLFIEAVKRREPFFT
jgi:cyclic pyranopterin phosphate synthase